MPGLAEIAVILVVAVIVFGPDKLPEFGRQAGRIVRQLRTMAQSAQTELRKELGPEYADLRLTDLDPRQAIRRHIIEALDEEGPDAPGPTGRAIDAGPTLAEGQLPPFDAEAT